MSSRFDQLRIWRASVGNCQVSHVLLETIPGARVTDDPVECAFIVPMAFVEKRPPPHAFVADMEGEPVIRQLF